MANFATLVEVKRRLNITDSTDDDLLNELLDATTGSFVQEMSRDPRQTTYTLERYNGTGGPRLMLRQKPITAVAFVSVDGVEIPQAATSQDAGYLFDDTELYFSSVVGRSPSAQPGAGVSPTSMFGRGFQNVLVTYTAGEAAGSLVLKDLANAQVWQVSYEFRIVSRIGEASENLGPGQNKNYITEDFLPQVLRTLKRHSQKAPVA